MRYVLVGVGLALAAVAVAVEVGVEALDRALWGGPGNTSRGV